MSNKQLSRRTKSQTICFLKLIQMDVKRPRFFKRFGFDVTDWIEFAEALKDHAETHDVVRETTSRYGTKYVIEGELSTPDERNPPVRTVWIAEPGETAARLVTAYPLKESTL